MSLGRGRAAWSRKGNPASPREVREAKCLRDTNIRQECIRQSTCVTLVLFLTKAPGPRLTAGLNVSWVSADLLGRKLQEEEIDGGSKQERFRASFNPSQ